MTTEGVKRKISAILSADVVGYSRLMEADELATVQTLESYRKTVSSLIQQHNGRVIDSPGDNILTEFGSVVDAVQCAVEIQQVIKAKNADLPDNRNMEFRVGINLGDVIEEGDRIYGDGINIASRIEGLADAGGICISGSAYEQIKSKLALGYENLGEHSVKNISWPIQVYRIPMGPDTEIRAGKTKSAGERRWRNAAIALLIVIGLVVFSAAVWYFCFYTPSEKVSTTETTTAHVKNSEPSLSKIPSIAVLPFENMSGDPQQEYFSDGMTEEIITKLSMNSMLTVIARNSTFYYKGKQVKIQQIGQELGARYVVEGSFRKAGNNIRITAQLIDAATGGHLWASNYDRELKDIFSLQDEIAHQVVAALNVESFAAERSRAMRIPTENLTAYDFWLQGAEHRARLTNDEIRASRSFYEQAIALDPEFAAAYTSLGWTYHWLYYFEEDPQILEQASELAKKAISLDDSYFDAHGLLAGVYMFKGWYERAIVEAERAVSLNPNEPAAYLIMGSTLKMVGRSKEAVGTIEMAMHLNPHYTADYAFELAFSYVYLGQYRKANEILNEAIGRNPDYIAIYLLLAQSYMEMWLTQQTDDPQALDQAMRAAKKVAALDENQRYYLSGAYLLKKQYDQAMAEAEKLITIAPWRPINYLNLASIYNHMGKPEDAIKMAEKAGQLAPENSTIGFGTLSFAYSLMGRYEEALKLLRPLPGSPLFSEELGNHLRLAILYSELDRIDEAKAEAAEILKLSPSFSVDVYGERIPYKDPAQAERDMAGLRKSGLK